eukprot:scaffold1139_cov62-Phaeocystis_antarctica.AAC.8
MAGFEERAHEGGVGLGIEPDGHHRGIPRAVVLALHHPVQLLEPLELAVSSQLQQDAGHQAGQDLPVGLSAVEDAIPLGGFEHLEEDV